MSRVKRSIKKVFKVFCEGDTENNYFEYIRKNKKIDLAIKPINMHGGGYSNFLSTIKEDSNSNCLAKFIIIDGDRATRVVNEDKCLNQIIEYCLNQNKSKRIPHILVIDYPDFEYVVCLHTYNYNGQSVERYITKELKYPDIESFKSDTNIFKVLVESEKGSINHLEKSINSHTSVISNKFKVRKKEFEIEVEMMVKKENLGKRGTNFFDFYRLLKELDIVVE